MHRMSQRIIESTEEPISKSRIDSFNFNEFDECHPLTNIQRVLFGLIWNVEKVKQAF